MNLPISIVIWSVLFGIWLGLSDRLRECTYFDNRFRIIFIFFKIPTDSKFGLWFNSDKSHESKKWYLWPFRSGYHVLKESIYVSFLVTLFLLMPFWSAVIITLSFALMQVSFDYILKIMENSNK
jgi:hypothetical protein